MFHPQIPRLVETFTLDTVHYIVQEFVDGYPLSYLLCNGQVFTESYVKYIIDQLLNLLIYLHEPLPTKTSIIHRDLRLSNLLLKNNKLYLIDFGLARFMDSNNFSNFSDIFENEDIDTPISRQGKELRIPGPFTYRLMRKKVCPESDLFGTGVIAIDLLSSQIKDEALLEEPWQKVLLISEAFIDYLEKLLSNERNFRSAKEALDALQSLPH